MDNFLVSSATPNYLGIQVCVAVVVFFVVLTCRHTLCAFVITNCWFINDIKTCISSVLCAIAPRQTCVSIQGNRIGNSKCLENNLIINDLCRCFRFVRSGNILDTNASCRPFFLFLSTFAVQQENNNTHAIDILKCRCIGIPISQC